MLADLLALGAIILGAKTLADRDPSPSPSPSETPEETAPLAEGEGAASPSPEGEPKEVETDARDVVRGTEELNQALGQLGTQAQAVPATVSPNGAIVPGSPSWYGELLRDTEPPITDAQQALHAEARALATDDPQAAGLVGFTPST